MYGRFTLRTPARAVAELFDLADEPTIVERFNVAPTQDVAVVRQDTAGARSLDLLRWGPVPSWGPEPGKAARLINARSATADRMPAFQEAFLTTAANDLVRRRWRHALLSWQEGLGGDRGRPEHFAR